jgi:hypothetical protein
MKDAYADTSPEALCALYLVQAADQAEKAVDVSSRWFIALPSMHLALGCALVAVLRGSASIGVYKEKVRRQYLAWFDNPVGPEPSNPWVEETRTLLRRAQDPSEAEMMGRPLSLTEDQIRDLERLADYRNDIEHVKPGDWHLQTGGLPRIMGAAAEALRQLFEEHGMRLHLEPEEWEAAKGAIDRIQALHAQYPSNPPLRHPKPE